MSSDPHNFAYHDAALKFLESAPTPKVQRQILGKISKLAIEPMPRGVKVLKGGKGLSEPVYRVRQGDYRILYLVRDDVREIVVLDIGHRKNIYRRNPILG